MDLLLNDTIGVVARDCLRNDLDGCDMLLQIADFSGLNPKQAPLWVLLENHSALILKDRIPIFDIYRYTLLCQTFEKMGLVTEEKPFFDLYFLSKTGARKEKDRTRNWMSY